jgi:predicted alpha/beta superfamily hydrolase
MKPRVFLLLVFVGTFLGACTTKRANQNNNKIIIGAVDSLYSKILNEERKIWVYEPVTDNLFAKQSYPVVYLLDGDAHFYSVMSIIQQLSEVNMSMVLPKMVVIGITNTDRTRDLTPTHVSFDPEIPDSNYLKTSGGAEAFTSFIEKELIPYVDSAYSASPYRILIGHSYGGLYCVNTLLNHTSLFNGYIAIDPSMNWDNRKLLNLAKDLLAQKKFKNTSLFLSIANQGYSDTDSLKDNSAAFELAKYLDTNRNNNLIFQWHYYKDDNHGSVPLISEYDGLRFIFDFYNPRISYTRFRDPSYSADSFIVEHFRKVSSHMGYTVSPPESFMNWLGYLFIMEKQYNKAFDVFKTNIDNYPASPNVYDSMGELQMVKGDTINAIENYEKSLRINPKNENAKNMIVKLKSKKYVRQAKD